MAAAADLIASTFEGVIGPFEASSIAVVSMQQNILISFCWPHNPTISRQNVQKTLYQIYTPCRSSLDLILP